MERYPWYKVKTIDGTAGWVYGKYLSGRLYSHHPPRTLSVFHCIKSGFGGTGVQPYGVQYIGNNGSTAVITLDTSLAQLEKTFGVPEFHPGIQEDGKGSWNPYAGFFPICLEWHGSCLYSPYDKVFSEDDISYIERKTTRSSGLLM